MKTIFWDFDGTLVHSPNMWSRAILKAIKEVEDTDLDPQTVRKHSRRGYVWDRAYLDNTPHTGDNFWLFMEKHFFDVCKQLGFSDASAKAIAPKVKKYILDKSNYTLYEDTVFVLEASKSMGYKNYIVSNNFPELDYILKELDLFKYFDDLIVSGVCGYDKPRGEIFQLALNLANNPKDVYMVGDNPIADILGAKALGIPAILVHRDVETNADYVCKTLLEVLEIIK